MGGGRTCLWYNGAMKLLLARALTGAFGAMSWDIPIGWNERRTLRLTPPVGEIPDSDLKQNFIITADGTVTVSKFGHWVSRGTNDCRIVDGVIVHPGVGE